MRNSRWRAQRGLGDMVHAPEIDGLSSMQKEYLLAMAQNDGPSSTGEIAKRLKRDAGYANVYRTQLDQGGRHLLARMGSGRFQTALHARPYRHFP